MRSIINFVVDNNGDFYVIIPVVLPVVIPVVLPVCFSWQVSGLRIRFIPMLINKVKSSAIKFV
ncbi:hypothetical protein BH11BAC7_BH11BAC7_14840 [soil metagenome]